MVYKCPSSDGFAQLVFRKNLDGDLLLTCGNLLYFFLDFTDDGRIIAPANIGPYIKSILQAPSVNEERQFKLGHFVAGPYANLERIGFGYLIVREV